MPNNILCDHCGKVVEYNEQLSIITFSILDGVINELYITHKGKCDVGVGRLTFSRQLASKTTLIQLMLDYNIDSKISDRLLFLLSK